MYFRIWKSPLVILLFLGYKAITVAEGKVILDITDHICILSYRILLYAFCRCFCCCAAVNEVCITFMNYCMYDVCKYTYWMKGGIWMQWVLASYEFLDDICSSTCAAECSSPCENEENCTSIIHNCTCEEGRTGVNCETGWYCDRVSLFVSTLVIQILPSFMCIRLEGNAEKALEKDWTISNPAIIVVDWC